MDKGAKYYRCDFQVHTPRDLNWKGVRPVSPEDRKEYAKKFVAACRQKGLDAVAVTDHHDFCFLPFIKAAADEEADPTGIPLPKHRRIVIFPGVELTLAVPCQAILIFDADMPVELLSNLYPLLGVTQNGDDEATHVQAERLDSIKSFDELRELLDKNDYLAGRYIILPNVTDGGSASIMRHGFLSIYKSMPCVGGYLDGPVSKVKDGTKRILDGKVDAWGSRKLGLFQTSDNRNDEFTELGKHSTWVKWAVPTAEALRQACLACETRISHDPPVVPSMVITRLEVSTSRFLGAIDVHFNPQYSCLIGGRGTGKSTILEYIRWALCDQPPSFADEDEAVAYQGKRANLIEKTLGECGGVVMVSFLLDSVPHVVRRSPQTKEVSLKIGGDDFKTCTEGDIRDLLPLQAYSQKQLSAVGIRTNELVRFIRTSIKADLDRLGADIDAQKASVVELFGSMMLKLKAQRALERDQLELASLTRRVEALRGELKGIGEDDQRVLANHDSFLQEEQIVERMQQELQSVREMATDFRSSLSGLPSPLPADGTLPNLGVVQQLQDALSTCLMAAAIRLDALIEGLTDASPEAAKFIELAQTWRVAFDAHNEHYKRAKADASSQQSQITQIDDAEARIKHLRSSVAHAQQSIDRFGPMEEEFRNGRAVWVDMYRSQADMMAQKCEELTTLSEQRIRAHIKRGAGVSKIQERLQELVTGTRIRSKKVEDLCETVANAADPQSTWAEVVAELEKLVDYSGGEADLPKVQNVPLLTAAGFSDNDFERLAPKMTPEKWLELSLTELEDIPVFEYRQTSTHYIQFADASAGQQATALLRVLLNQAGPPLLIDQPEEDLDNQVILEIVQEIWQAKKGRQIIFSSHNPNIVVNGDADLVVCCDYRTAGDHSGGQIKLCGAIDVEEIKREITVVMEGGRDAFRLRKEKYGF